jgi:hypothetical protein
LGADVSQASANTEAEVFTFNDARAADKKQVTAVLEGTPERSGFDSHLENFEASPSYFQAQKARPWKELGRPVGLRSST